MISCMGYGNTGSRFKRLRARQRTITTISKIIFSIVRPVVLLLEPCHRPYMYNLLSLHYTLSCCVISALSISEIFMSV